MANFQGLPPAVSPNAHPLGKRVALASPRMKCLGQKLALKLTLLVFATGLASPSSAEEARSSSAAAVSEMNLSLAELEIESSVKVETVKSLEAGTEILVHLPNGENIEIPVNLAGTDSLSPEEKEKAIEDAREILELTTNAILSDEFNGAMVVGTDQLANVLEASPDSVKALRHNWLKRAFQINPEMYRPMPKGLPFPDKFKRFISMSWQFIFVETVHAAIDYYKNIRSAPEFLEFGISVDLKIEPQIFIGKFNPTGKVKALRRSYGLALELGFNKVSRRLFLRTRLRRERGSGGLGLPAVKAELKVFQTDGTRSAQGGQSWYPVSPPVASFVLDRDHSGHYFAQGLTIGFNTGDLVPGSTLTNTFAHYQQTQDAVRLDVLPSLIHENLKKATRLILPRGPRTCTDLFADFALKTTP